ncbi:MAG: hypothetical protein JXP48_11000 [Acidobacteria bacterium]|nr:hypothetical protein [Acidobacteriota bacterium]
MDDFRPSPDFRERVMDDVRSYESALSHRKQRLQAFLGSGPGLVVLAATGALAGMVQLVRLTALLVFPALCH